MENIVNQNTMSDTTNGKIKINESEITVYVHPSTHPASMIETDTEHRFITDEQLTSLNKLLELLKPPVEEPKPEEPPTDSPYIPKYYVDSINGNDNNNGLSSSTPWKTLSKVYNNAYNPGDVIALKCGSVWKEQLSTKSSGTYDKPIIYTSYGIGAKPKICANNEIIDWIQENTLYYCSSNKPNSITKNGALMKNVSSKEKIASGNWWYDATNGRIYIIDNPVANTIEISARQYALFVTKNYIVFDNLDIMGGYAATRIDGTASNITIQNCDIHEAFYCLLIADSCKGYLNILNNHIYNCYCNGISANCHGGANDIKISGNEIDHCGVYSEQVIGGLYPQGMFMGTNSTIIEHNKVHDIYNPKGSGYSHGIYTGGKNFIVRYNEFYDCICSGVKLMSKDDLVYYNIIHQCSWGVEVEGAENTTILNNTIYDCGCGVRAVTGYNKIAGSIKSLRNNIIFDCYANGGKSPSNVLVFPDCVVKDADYNLLWSSRSSDVCHYQGKWLDFKGWQALGFDQHGISVDPKVTDAKKGDFHLQPASPCINTGVNVELDEDYDGNPVIELPNIGAYE